MLNLDHKKLEVWRKSVVLVKQIYSITNKYPSEEKFGLVSQLRRASVLFHQTSQKELLDLLPRNGEDFMK